jgi:cytochrome bd-type quinol oxidase subunit 2
MVLGAFAANETGWVSAEVGRQPWIVYGLLKTKNAVSTNLKVEDVWASIIMFGAAMYPNLIVARDNPAFNIDVYNGASSHKTFGIMLIVAALGMPFVCCYTFIVYWVFRGKTQLNKHSY